MNKVDLETNRTVCENKQKSETDVEELENTFHKEERINDEPFDQPVRNFQNPEKSTSEIEE